jgi:hypothetical protein
MNHIEEEKSNENTFKTESEFQDSKIQSPDNSKTYSASVFGSGSKPSLNRDKLMSIGDSSMKNLLSDPYNGIPIIKPNLQAMPTLMKRNLEANSPGLNFPLQSENGVMDAIAQLS